MIDSAYGVAHVRTANADADAPSSPSPPRAAGASTSTFPPKYSTNDLVS
jgi:hypothetical protein